jgi:copper chaperone
MAEILMKIEGMSCNHCVMRVKKAIDQLSGVSESVVEIGTAKVVFDEKTITKEAVSKAVSDAGYKVVE